MTLFPSQAEQTAQFKLDDWIAQCKDKDARIAELVEALKKYGKHADDCCSWLHVGFPGGYRCTCGFPAALSQGDV